MGLKGDLDHLRVKVNALESLLKLMNKKVAGAEESAEIAELEKRIAALEASAATKTAAAPAPKKSTTSKKASG